MTTSLSSCLAFVPAVLDPHNEAANDGLPRGALGYEWTDVNLLVATTVARVSARMRPSLCNVALDLDDGDPVVAGDAVALGFALAGTLAALIRSAEETGGEHDLRVCVAGQGRQVCVSMVGLELPSFAVLRALDGGNDPRLCDPTVAHCRRLIEGQGGSLVLEVQDGQMALALRLPVAPASKGTRVAAALGNPGPYLTASSALALAA
ncbi:MAG: hypothetical protein IAG13_26770 [Deltaproteobacteria bacterium]|nr:hypothetical protein [Nannocystaceae bacterium]